MKNLIIGFGILTAVLFLFGAIAMVETDSGKETALKENLRTAIYQTMDECKDPALQQGVWNRYDSAELSVREGFQKEDELMVLCFKDNLKQLMQTTDDVKIRVIEADWEKGILCVEVMQTYTNLGVKRATAAKETVIYNKYVK